MESVYIKQCQYCHSNDKSVLAFALKITNSLSRMGHIFI